MADIRFDGRVAVITGAGGGLGRTYALEIARRGGMVVVNDLGGKADGTGGSHNMADQTVKEINESGGKAVANYDSVSTPQGGEAIIKAALDNFGRVDIVINNAGILRDKTFAKLPPEDLEIVLDVHLKGAFYVTQPAFRVMKEQNYGRILFTASGAGIFGNFGRRTTAPRRWASSASRTCSRRRARRTTSSAT
jgi:NAD(P)-dependent dehydrogenase (short-subunit alcohol dehydrogenase family)